MALFDYGQQWWKQEMAKMLGIGTGAIQPTDLPEYKGLAQNMQTMGNQQNQNMLRQAIGQGIGGGSLATLLQGGNENIMKQLLAAIQQTYGQAQQRGAQGASTMLDWEKFQRQQQLQHLAMQLQAMAQRNAQQGTNQYRNLSLGMDLAKSLALGAGTAMFPAIAPATVPMMAQTGSKLGSSGQFSGIPEFDFNQWFSQQKW